MSRDQQTREQTPRRDFLKTVSAAAATSGLLAGSVAGAENEPTASPLPEISLGPHRISRMVAGWNPVGGHSHTTLNMARLMREYFTTEQTVAFLQNCEAQGINTWQYDYTDKGVAAIKAMREAGSKMKYICLHAERSMDTPMKEVVDQTGPIALVHHGGVTDALFRAGKSQQVHDYVKKVHDMGVLAGVSAHNPDNIKRIADEGWENDLFMTCFYYVTRPREEQQEQLGKVVVGEPFFQSDPDDMTKVAKQVEKPCLGFKILAAGRACWSSYSVEKAFRFAFENLKPIDGLVVGMFPKYFDEVKANAEYARKYGAIG
ncbi:MAG: hypothetical protein HQ581_24815 [Planctomycetes bacterium]|nr:hypothetical protein [Planctomycetota bacterium]